jgi:PAS domain S-box-containing protein
MSTEAGRLPNAIVAPGSPGEHELADDRLRELVVTDEPINILLVDDEAKNLTVLESVLANPQYRLVRAESADQALMALIDEEFALLVLDIQMPGMNGFELAQMIKQRKKTAGLPIIFLTAYYSEDEHVLEGYSTGAVDYLHKPINPAILRSKVAVFAELHRKTRECSLANRALLAEVTHRRRAQDELHQLAEQLEQRVADRTAALVQVNAALRESEERLKLAQSAGRVGVWDWNAVTGDTYWSESMWMIYGIEPVDPARVRERWAALLHPDDRKRIEAEMFATVDSGENLFRGEYRILPPNGGPRWIESVARLERDASGNPLRMVGVNIDVTERKRAADLLRLSEERLQLALKNSRILVYTTDRELRYTWISGPNAAFMPAQVLGRRDDELLSPQQAAPLIDLKRRVLETGAGEHGEWAVEVGGRRLEYDVTVEPLLDDSGNRVGVIVAAMEITELKEAEAALKRADRQKDEFLATLAHELRNPLAPIRNAVQVLHLQGSDQNDLQWAKDVIDRQSQHLTRLVDDLLDISRITADKLELRMESVKLEDVVKGAVETSGPLIKQCGHELILALPSDPVVLTADLTRLSQVLSNLLNNAAKYTEPGGTITLSAERQGGELVVSVRDNGMGIPAEMLPYVFDLFAQVDRHLDRSQGGLGIGLRLVKRLAEMHGGSIEALSAGTGKGSNFIVKLPLQSDPTPLAKANPETLDKPLTAALRIVIVDDNKDSVESLRILLQRMGHTIRVAYDGVEGIAIVEEFRPDVVLLDIGMPKLNGYETCRRIRAQDWGKQTVLIAQTGWGQDEDRRRTDEAGFDHHLVKPVSPTALKELLAQIMGEAGSRDDQTG